MIVPKIFAVERFVFDKYYFVNTGMKHTNMIWYMTNDKYIYSRKKERIVLILSVSLFYS